MHYRREYHRRRRNERLSVHRSSSLSNINRANEEERFMSNQVVLITGALTGIGRATAVAFAEAGANVVISGRHADEGQKLAAELRTLGANSEFVRADVRREIDVQNVISSDLIAE
jgi:short-subunit dehydrogenase